MRMAMAGPGYSMATIKIKILLAVSVVEPDSGAKLRHNGHLLVGGQLIEIFYCSDLFKLCSLCFHHGFVPSNINPLFSSKPNIKFIFCTAWPAAPFTRLSNAENTTTCRPRVAKPMSQKFVVFTQ